MYAELLININTPLDGTFHYSVPTDMEDALRVGHLVEVEFGRRLAQAVILAFDEQPPVDVEMVKPIIALIDEEPIVLPTQIGLARWMSAAYLTPINACMRLFFPPGLSAYSPPRLQTLSSLRTMRSSATPPNTMAPRRPLPTGIP